MQCLPGGTLVHYDGLGAAYERWFQGPYQHLVLDDGRELCVTRNHPVVSHVGWKAAWEIKVGWYVLTVDSPDEGVPIDLVFHEAAEDNEVHVLPGTSRDFHGDGATGVVRAVAVSGLVSAMSPYRASEGTIPAGHPYKALAWTTQPNALGFSNWSELRRHVPGIDKMWPERPYPETLPADLAAELPPPVLDHDAESRRLVGVPGKLRLRRVDQAWTGIAGSYVYNMSVKTGAYLAAGVVVGNCSLPTTPSPVLPGLA